VARLLDRLREAGADEQAAALASRAAAHAALDNPRAVAVLLGSLREAGAHEQAALASRAAARAPRYDPPGVFLLLNRLQEAGAHEQAAALADQLPAAGMFGLFLDQKGLADQFRFGREADGTPATPWGWEDLDLWLVPPTAGTVSDLARRPTADPPNSQGKSGQFRVRASRVTLRSPAQRSGSSQSSLGQDIMIRKGDPMIAATGRTNLANQRS
jgi:hypothetical protein